MSYFEKFLEVKRFQFMFLVNATVHHNLSGKGYSLGKKNPTDLILRGVNVKHSSRFKENREFILEPDMMTVMWDMHSD